MSIRVHQLAKKLNISNNELLEHLAGLNYPVKSVSSTVDNITAESIEAEFRRREAVASASSPPAPTAAPAAVETVPAPATEPPPAPVPASSPSAAPAPPLPASPSQTSPPPPAPAPRRATQTEVSFVQPVAPSPVVPRPSLSSVSAPKGPMVKTAEEAQRERQERERARQLNPPSAHPVILTTHGGQARPLQVPAPAQTRAAPAQPAIRPASPAPAGPNRLPSPAPARPPATSTGAPRNPPPPVPVSSVPRTVGSTPVAPPPLPNQPMPAAPGTNQTGARAAPAGEVRTLMLRPPIIVRDFAGLLGIRPFQLISELMKGFGIFASMNTAIEESIAHKIAEQYGFLLEVRHRGEGQQTPAVQPKETVDESKLLEERPPVVCVMGHVDHGKTSLLDAIRRTNVVASEAGGITQHIGAYQIEHKGKRITFLDTPGHAAFSQMRARGARVGDIVVLVVAADDGFMPQTEEALRTAREARVTIIACINKIDVKGANIDRVKQQLQERGLTPEDWGGETITVATSATKGQGIPDLLDNILVQAEILELKANPKAPATGVVIEAETEVGIGHTATVIVQRGTIKEGDALVCGPHYAKVRAMFDDRGARIKSAGPSTPVRVPGWSGVPEVGSSFTTAKNDREARRQAEENAYELRTKSQQAAANQPTGPVTAEELLKAINAGQKKTLRILVKADVFGSVEAIRDMLGSIRSEKVALEIIKADVGLITKNDVLMASTSEAEIVGFQVKREAGVEALAKHHGVPITDFAIIYELYEGVRNRMADLLEPELRETKLGLAQVRQVFPTSKGFVAGCLVTEGRVVRESRARVLRARKVVATSSIVSIRRVKDDVVEVRAGTECGVRLADFDAFQPNDEIESYEVHKVRPSL